MTAPKQYSHHEIPAHPEQGDFAAWLVAEVEERTATYCKTLVDERKATWIADPEVDNVYALRRVVDDAILLVIYEQGYDFETSTDLDDAVMADYEYSTWLAALDREVIRISGVSVHDLPDVPFMAWFQDEVSPADAAADALDLAGFGS